MEHQPAPPVSSPPSKPSPPRKKFQPDVGWDERLRGYVCRALVRFMDGHWVASPKDLCVADGIGPTEDDALRSLRSNYRKKIEECVGANPPQMIPWTEISNVLIPGARVLRLKIDAAPPRKPDDPPLIKAPDA